MFLLFLHHGALYGVEALQRSIKFQQPNIGCFIIGAFIFLALFISCPHKEVSYTWSFQVLEIKISANISTIPGCLSALYSPAGSASKPKRVNRICIGTSNTVGTSCRHTNIYPIVCGDDFAFLWPVFLLTAEVWVHIRLGPQHNVYSPFYSTDPFGRFSFPL